jgi:hypothetical protein
MKTRFVFTMAVTFASLFFTSVVMGRSFTLSDADLMSLDWYLDSRVPDDPNAARIISKRDVPGPGVEFDIYFPKDNKAAPHTYSLYYVSCKQGGEGTLTGIDVNDYDAFALKFALVAVDGKPKGGGSLVVGALINTDYSYAYRPEVIGFTESEKTMVVSSTSTNADKISIIGFTVRKFTRDDWNPMGTTVTLRIEPAPNAEIPR